MPKDAGGFTPGNIHNIRVIGSGPIVIGQGAEFDYSGTQACKALREEGFSVVLINSNPAAIMTFAYCASSASRVSNPNSA